MKAPRSRRSRAGEPQAERPQPGRRERRVAVGELLCQLGDADNADVLQYSMETKGIINRHDLRVQQIPAQPNKSVLAYSGTYYFTLQEKQTAILRARNTKPYVDAFRPASIRRAEEMRDALIPMSIASHPFAAQLRKFAEGQREVVIDDDYKGMFTLTLKISMEDYIVMMAHHKVMLLKQVH